MWRNLYRFCSFCPTKILFHSLINHLNPTLVASAFKWRIEPGLDNLERGFDGHHTLAYGDSVGIIMLATEPGRFNIPAKCTANSLYAVSHHRFAIAGTTQHNAALTFTL